MIHLEKPGFFLGLIVKVYCLTNIDRSAVPILLFTELKSCVEAVGPENCAKETLSFSICYLKFVRWDLG